LPKEIHSVLSALPSLAPSTPQPNCTLSLLDIQALLRPAYSTQSSKPQTILSHLFAIFSIILTSLSPFWTSQPQLVIADRRSRELAARTNLASVELVGCLMVGMWRDGREKRRMEMASEGDARMVMRDIAVESLHCKGCGCGEGSHRVSGDGRLGKETAGKARKEELDQGEVVAGAWEMTMDELERRRGGSPPPDTSRSTRSRRTDMHPPTRDASSILKDRSTSTSTIKADQRRTVEDTLGRACQDGVTAMDVLNGEGEVRVAKGPATRMRSEDARGWWMYLVLAGVCGLGYVL
jgi:hypothetical protein